MIKKDNFYEMNKKYSKLGMEGLTFDFIRNSYSNSQQKQIQKQRYDLTSLVGQKIKCQALLLPGLRTKIKRRNGEEMTMRTLINVNYKGNLVADHIQVNLYGETPYDDKQWDVDDSDCTKRIDIVGIVYNYMEGDDIKYSIALTEKPRFQDDKIMINHVLKYDEHLDDILYKNICRQGLVDCSLLTKKLLIKRMRDRINELTMHELPHDFLWNYLINQFTLNRLSIYMEEQNIDLYLDYLTTLQCDLLITIMSYLLTIFESDITIFNLYNIFKLIVILCSKAQYIKSFEYHDDDFDRFCTQFDMSDIFGERGWLTIKHNVKNYKLTDNDLDLSNYVGLEFTSEWTRAACVSYYLSEIKNNKTSNNNVKDK